jgi:hypothetical protein
LIAGCAVLLACFDDFAGLGRELGEGLGFWLVSRPEELPDFVAASPDLALPPPLEAFEAEDEDVPPCTAAAARPAASVRASVAVP